jgi:hypothetical protein
MLDKAIHRIELRFGTNKINYATIKVYNASNHCIESVNDEESQKLSLSCKVKSRKISRTKNLPI